MINDIDIVCISESHLDEDIFVAVIAIPGFDIFRKDRNFKLDRTAIDIEGESSTGGGSVIFVKNHMNAEILESFNAPDSKSNKIGC